ncbi:hypothetical protein ACFWMG_21280 [Streptomyces sp. NPDC127074]|uniref:hypothetical protein n=1 Tax=Streptomyces sp. NPDC127074 TaxID=3347130 RepID=UPI00365384DA
MFRGINDLSGRLLELYKLRRDGTYFDQQQFLHLLREDEASAAELRLAEREEQAAAVRAAEASRSNRYEVERDWRQAQISVQVKAEQDRLERNFTNSPFSYSADELHTLAYEVTGGGARPALLVAPFFHEELNREENDDGPQAFRVAIRRAWVNSPWAADVSPLDGAIKRPLRNTDLDVVLLQRALRDLPIMLVCGDVQTGRRVWPSLIAWNIFESPDFRCLQVNFPPLSLPVGVSDEELRRSARLAFEDELGHSTAVTIGVLGEWFHLAHYGRRPRIHRTLPENQGLERRAAALGLTAAYDVAIERGRIPLYEARAEQAALFLAVGLRDEARSAALSSLRVCSSEQDEHFSFDVLRTLRSVLATVGSAEELAAATRIAEESARRSALRSLGW